MKKIRLVNFVVAHKNFDRYFPDNSYKVIFVGNKQNNINNEDVRDNTKNNISFKNKNYCELTAMYWIWKNVKDIKYVGINHYRRYFTLNIFNNLKRKKISEIKTIKILEKYDIIVPYPSILKKENVLEQYAKSHYKKDLLLCGKVIKEIYPEYYDSFETVMNRNYYFQYNMLITDKKIYDEYMTWLFNVLFEVEERVDIAEYNDYNKRIYGFLSERLFNVWIDKNKKYKLKLLPTLNTEVKYKKMKIMIKSIYCHFLNIMINKRREI